MKRILSLLLTLLLVLALFSGCKIVKNSDGKPTIVVTVFPIYDWVKNILGDRADQFRVKLLMENGSDLHSFNPGLADMQAIHTADVFVYVGGESDKWVPGALKDKTNDQMHILSLMDKLGSALREEEYVEGMVREEEEDEADAVEYDEHIWLSLRNAETACSAICETLCLQDPEHARTYRANTEAYLAKLEALDGRYTAVVEAAPLHTLIFADRFPFRYLVEDYGLDYYAAYSGCSSEVGVSITTVPFLAGKVDEIGAKYVLCLEGGGSDLPGKVVSEAGSAGVGILNINSMQFVNRAAINEGATYLGIMEQNLDVLTKALSTD